MLGGPGLTSSALRPRSMKFSDIRRARIVGPVTCALSIAGHGDADRRCRAGPTLSLKVATGPPLRNQPQG